MLTIHSFPSPMIAEFGVRVVYTNIKKCFIREFPGGLVVRIPAFTAVARVRSLVGELKSLKLWGLAKKSEYFLITALIFRHNILKQPNQEPLNDTYAA